MISIGSGRSWARLGGLLGGGTPWTGSLREGLGLGKRRKGKNERKKVGVWG